MTPDEPRRMAEGCGFGVLVMAKYPEVGRVKTRLARKVGAEGAARLHGAFIVDLGARLGQAGIPTTWAVFPAEAPFGELVPGAAVVPQEGTDLGARMEAAVGRLFTGDGAPVIVLGADVPHVAMETVREAGDWLARGGGAVLGPAEDGGYYLLGLRWPLRELFRGMPWGGPEVCRLTEERLARLGVGYRRMPREFDVDEPADLERLAGLIRTGRVRLPRTAAVLAELGIS